MAGVAGKSIHVASIAGPHGVRGLVRLQSFTDPVEGLAAYETLANDQGQCFAIELLSRDRTQFLARIEGVADRTQAETLKGLKLYVPRDDLPQTEDGGYYHADLIGLEAVDPDGMKLGTVQAVHNFGASDILDVHGENRPDFMVPFVEAFVPEVDLEAGRLVIAPFELSQ